MAKVNFYNVQVYSVTADGQETHGMRYFAGIKAVEAEQHSEIEKIGLWDAFPEKWT